MGATRGSEGREGSPDSQLRQVVLQFQLLDMVVVGVGWGAATLNRWCQLCQGAATVSHGGFWKNSTSTTLLASSRCSQLGNLDFSTFALI